MTVGEPSAEDALNILRGLREKYEAHHKLKISDEALEAAVELSIRYIADRYLPDKAIDLIDEAASRLRIRAHTSPDGIKVKEEELKQVCLAKESAILSQEFERAAALRDKEQELKKEIEEERSHWRTSQDENTLLVQKSDIAEVVTLWTGIPVHNLLTEDILFPGVGCTDDFCFYAFSENDFIADLHLNERDPVQFCCLTDHILIPDRKSFRTVFC